MNAEKNQIIRILSERYPNIRIVEIISKISTPSFNMKVVRITESLEKGDHTYIKSHVIIFMRPDLSNYTTVYLNNHDYEIHDSSFIIEADVFDGKYGV